MELLLLLFIQYNLLILFFLFTYIHDPYLKQMLRFQKSFLLKNTKKLIISIDSLLQSFSNSFIK